MQENGLFYPLDRQKEKKGEIGMNIKMIGAALALGLLAGCAAALAPKAGGDTRSAEKSGAEVVIGSSLGGFFAALISVRLGLPAVLINPCLMPFLHLPRLGYEGDIRPFMQLFGELSGIDEKKVYTIVGGSDEVIDTHDMTRNLLRNTHFEVVPNGGHSGSTLPLERFFSEVLSN